MTNYTLPENFDWPVGAHLDKEGIWCQILPTAPMVFDHGPALFLDRDGVIVEEVHYLHRVEDVRVAVGAVDLIRTANDRRIPIVVVTNQAGIGRGLYDWTHFATVQQHILSELTSSGVHVNAVFACPFHRTGSPPWVHPDHPARKPNPGMVLRGLDAFPIQADQSWIIGDRAGDMGAGLNAGLAGGVHLLCGHGSADGERVQALAVANPNYAVVGADDLRNATRHIPFLR